MGAKLTATDIDIVYEGKAVLRHIVREYGSVERFIEEKDIKLLPGTLNKRLKSRRISSKRVRGMLVPALDKGWDELVKPVSKQVDKYCDLINRNIKVYNSRKDVQAAEKLIRICKRDIECCAEENPVEAERLRICLSKAYRAKGMIYFYCGELSTAEEFVKLAIEQIEGKIIDLMISVVH